MGGNGLRVRGEIREHPAGLPTDLTSVPEPLPTPSSVISDLSDIEEDELCR